MLCTNSVAVLREAGFIVEPTEDLIDCTTVKHEQYFGFIINGRPIEIAKRSGIDPYFCVHLAGLHTNTMPMHVLDQESTDSVVLHLKRVAEHTLIRQNVGQLLDRQLMQSIYELNILHTNLPQDLHLRG